MLALLILLKFGNVGNVLDCGLIKQKYRSGEFRFPRPKIFLFLFLGVIFSAQNITLSVWVNSQLGCPVRGQGCPVSAFDG